MSRQHEGLILNYNAGATVNGFRIVKHGTSDQEVIQAAANTDAIIGVAEQLGADAAGEPIDVWRTGVAQVEYGGNVTRGDPLTADADGKAITAAPAAGANVRLVGFAEVSGVAGDIGSVQIELGSMQG